MLHGEAVQVVISPCEFRPLPMQRLLYFLK
jgi:hypothetical protein